MARRSLPAVLVVVLVATAGCSFLGGQATETPTATGTPTATATPSPTPTPSYRFPAGYAESGVTDGSAAMSTHRDAITSLDSYTLTYRATINSSDSNLAVRYDQPTDLADERALVATNFSSSDRELGSSTRFYTSNTLYVRSDPPGENNTQYTNRSTDFRASQFTGEQFVRPMLVGVAYGEATIVERSGERLARYESTELTNASAVFGQGVDAENVTSFSATLWVDDSGVVTRIEYSATVDDSRGERSVEAVVAVTDVDETTVERPDWVSRA